MQVEPRKSVRRSAPSGSQLKPGELDLQTAIRLWTDSAIVARLDALRGTFSRSWWDDDDDAHLLERLRLRQSLVRHFLQLLSDETLALTGIVAPITLASRREVIPPDIIEVLHFDIPAGQARAPGLKLIHLKVHAAEGAAGGMDDGWRAIRDDRKEASIGLSEFTHNADYSRVTMREHVFDLSGGLCQIVARLHAASRTADSWLVGKQLMAACGYASTFIGSAFKRHHSPCWRELVEGNGRGLYRLNLQAPPRRRMSGESRNFAG